MDKTTIRRASKTDLKDVVAIETVCFGDDAFSPRVLSYLIAKSRGGVYVVQHGNQSVAYISLLQRKGCGNLRVYSVAVLPEFAGHGIGRKLLEFTAAQAAARGLDRITLEVRTDNKPAIGLYESFGFEKRKRLPSYYHDGTDGYYMVKPL